MITCRRAEQDDAALFREVRLRALKDSPEAFGSTYENALERDIDSWREQIQSTVSSVNRNTQFAFDGELCVGIAALYREEGADTGDIIMMWVSPEARGSGAAPLLISNLMDWASAVGMSEVLLNVTDSNERAIQFYLNYGFVSTGDIVDCDASRCLKAIRMSKKVV
ncbi:N-acetyltransferase [Oceaniferula spumae]|uniref:N-acetyltransferase n=1 Tax=Oceaniferula spumae TaxID=2979115 RepID=A0AAT9FN97_9BACT